jgi:putative hydrolase of the HAD superfamily
MGFADAFDALYFSCDLGFMKPHSDFYRSIEGDLGVAPSHVHFWDDTPAHVRGAQEVGWNAYLFEGLWSINVR